MTECKILFSLKLLMKVKVLRANFTIQANFPMQNYFGRQLTPKVQKENQHSSRMKKFTTFSWSETNNKQAGGQVKLLFRMNCPIINLWNKQTDPWGETSFSWKHQEFIVGEKQENYLKKTKYDKIVSSSFLRVSRVSERSWLNQSHKHTFCTVW